MSVLLVAGASWVLGAWAFRLAGLGNARQAAALRIWVGLGLCGLLILLLGAVSFHAARFILYAVTVVGLGYEVLLRSAPMPSAAETPMRGPFGWACGVLAALGIALALVGSLAPETGWEAGVAHLAAAADWVRLDRVTPWEGNPFTGHATPVHALYAYGLFDGGESAARLMSWGFGALACGSMAGLCGRMGGGAAGWTAAAVLSTTPVFFSQTATASVDLATAGLVLAALWAWVAWEQEGRVGWLALAGVLAGAAAGTRGVALAAVAMLVLATAATPRVGRGRASAVLAGAAVLMLIPWWFYGMWGQGGFGWPGYPYVGGLAEVLGVAPAPDAPALRDLALSPWDIVMRPARLGGDGTHSPGGLVLFLGLPALAVAGPWARRLGLFSAAGVAVLVFLERAPQAHLPFLAPLMAAAALAAVRFPLAPRLVKGLVLVHLVFGLGAGLWILREEAAVLVGREAREAYRARRVPTVEAFAWTARQLGPGEAVVSLDPRTYWIEAPAYRDYARLAELARRPRPERLRLIDGLRVRYLVYPAPLLDDLAAYRESRLAETVQEWRAADRVFKRFHVPGAHESQAVEVHRIAADRP